jgi:integrase/recombinase XerD
MPAQPATEAGSAVVRLTRASNDQQLVASWLASLSSSHSRRNCATTAERFLEELRRRDHTLQTLTVIEDLRDVLAAITQGCAASTARQYILRVKSLLSYAHRLGYTLVNVGAAIRTRREVRSLAKRIVGELAIRDLIRQSRNQRDHVLQSLTYGAGLRVSEAVGLNVGDVLAREDGRVQVHVLGKGGKERDNLLPKSLGPLVLALCEGRSPEAPLFVSRDGRRLGTRAVNHIVKAAAKRAKVTTKISPHWLRHGHASHALTNGADVAVVAKTLGHANIATTSDYLHAQPDSSSGDNLKDEVWARPEE